MSYIFSWLILGVSVSWGAAPSLQFDPALQHCGVTERLGSEREKRLMTKASKNRPVVASLSELSVHDLNAMAMDLRPVVEEASGARFKTMPGVRVGTKEAVQNALRQDASLFIRRLYDAPEHVLESMIASSVNMYYGILGKYDLQHSDVLLAPEVMNGVIQRGGFEGRGIMDAACLVLAHELTHALQDQMVDLGGQLTSFRDQDEFDAARGVNEGHATFVEWRVAQILGLEDVFWQLNEVAQGWGKQGLMDPAAFETYALYGQGMKFIRTYYDRSGIASTWRPLQKPPSTTAVLFRPELYGSGHVVDLKYAGVLNGVEQKLTKGDWAVIHSYLGEFALRVDMAGLEESAVSEVLAHIVSSYQMAASRSDRRASVRVIDFDASAPAQAYLDLLEKGQEAMAKARSTRGVKWSVTVTPYDAISGDAAVRRVIAPVGAHASAVETQSVWVVRGNRLVVVNVSGFRPGLRMDWTLEEVYQRLGESGN